MTLLVAGTYRVPLEQLDAIGPHMTDVIDATVLEEGCIDYSYALDLVDPGLIRVFELWVDEEAHKAQADVDLYFSPAVEQYGMLEWKQFDRIVEAGYRHGLEQIELAGEARIARFRHGH